MSKLYKARSAKAGKSFQANPVLGSKRRSNRPRTWFASGKPVSDNDDIPEPLPADIFRGSLYVAPVEPEPVPMAEKEFPYCVPNAKRLRRQIREAQLKRENVQREAAGLPKLKAPWKRPKTTPATKERKPRAKRAPVASPVDRAKILADLRSRKASR